MKRPTTQAAHLAIIAKAERAVKQATADLAKARRKERQAHYDLSQARLDFLFADLEGHGLLSADDVVSAAEATIDPIAYDWDNGYELSHENLVKMDGTLATLDAVKKLADRNSPDVNQRADDLADLISEIAAVN